MAESRRNLLWAFLVCLLITVLLGTLYSTPLFAIAFPISLGYVFWDRLLRRKAAGAKSAPGFDHT